MFLLIQLLLSCRAATTLSYLNIDPICPWSRKQVVTDKMFVYSPCERCRAFSISSANTDVMEMAKWVDCGLSGQPRSLENKDRALENTQMIRWGQHKTNTPNIIFQKSIPRCIELMYRVNFLQTSPIPNKHLLTSQQFAANFWECLNCTLGKFQLEGRDPNMNLPAEISHSK